MPILMSKQPTPDPSLEGIDGRVRLRFTTGEFQKRHQTLNIKVRGDLSMFVDISN